MRIMLMMMMRKRMPIMMRIMRRMPKRISDADAVMIYQSHVHNQRIEMPRYVPNNTVSLNEDLRVMFIMKEIDEKTWRNKLKAVYQKYKRNRELYQILEKINVYQS
jgi:hypothetical protein